MIFSHQKCKNSSPMRWSKILPNQKAHVRASFYELATCFRPSTRREDCVQPQIECRCRRKCHRWPISCFRARPLCQINDQTKFLAFCRKSSSLNFNPRSNGLEQFIFQPLSTYFLLVHIETYVHLTLMQSTCCVPCVEG